MSSDEHGTSNSRSRSTGWTTVDDLDSLPRRFADTGWGRPSFFQNILNIAENRHAQREATQSPVPSSRPDHTLQRTAPSSSSSFSSPFAAYSPHRQVSNMPRRTGFIDLTASSSDVTPSSRVQQRTGGDYVRFSSSPEAGPSSKRVKRNDGTSNNSHAEQIDLSQDEPDELESALQKQRMEAVKAQEPLSTKALRMSTLTCIICLDTPKDLTATACGHWFCHTCLMEALIAGENRAAPGEARRSQCPVCRKTLSRQKASDVFPALMMKGLATQPKKKATNKSKA